MRMVLKFSALLLVLPVTVFGQNTLAPEQEAVARRLLNSQGCKACHRFEGGATEIGAGLKEVSRGLDGTQLTRSLVNSDGTHGNGLIPDFSHMEPEEIEALVSFLKNLSSAAE